MNQNDNKNEYEILDSGNLSYQPRYPLANAPGSKLQNMGYKEWRDMCPDAKRQLLKQIGISPFEPDEWTKVGQSLTISAGLVAAIAGVASVAFPPLAIVAGAFAIISMFFDVLWPESENNTNSQVVWADFAAAAEEMMDEKIADEIKAEAVLQLRIVQSRLRDYQQAACNFQSDPNNESYKALLRDAFDDADDALKEVMILFSREGYEQLLLFDYVQAANLHLLLLKDVVRFGVGWGFPPGRVEQYYSNPTNLGNPGMVQLLAKYTNYSTSLCWKGIEERKWMVESEYRSNNEEYYAYRSNMTMMVLDMVALWPTYDPVKYPYATAVELTREIYSLIAGGFRDYKGYMPIQYTWEKPGSLVTNLERFTIYTWKNFEYFPFAGVETTYQTIGTGSSSTKQAGVIPSPEEGTAWTTPGINVEYHLVESFIYGTLTQLLFYDVYNTPAFKAGSDAVEVPGSIAGTPCKNIPLDANDVNVCVPTLWEESPANPEGVCYPYNREMQSNLLSEVIPEDPKLLTLPHVPPLGYIDAFAFAWRSTTCDTRYNLIPANKIGQIPAVKGNWLGQSGSSVVRTSGNTGGDVVRLYEFGNLGMTVRFSENRSYIIRLRYATVADDLNIIVRVQRRGELEYESELPLNQTSNNSTTQWKFEDYGYQEVGGFYPQVGEEYELWFSPVGTELSSHMDIDKIEFIPMETSLEEYLANQDIEKARKAVNALFTGDVKNALKLNVTDYAIDQAANLVECVSEEFYAQEKMILLDQVKVAKRLSQARNLLNYGDFESPEWSRENGWKTSRHVSVRADNPVFKGRYLHMPGVTSPSFSNNTYPTYVYQKVDESKLKSYTRYLVRGFVGNSKDLELLVERYGKDVHVEMDVPHDIRYSLQTNECGGFDRCRPVSYLARSSHACTCKDTASMHTDCQCQNKANRTVTNMYTNVSPGSAMYTDGFHAQKSCGCKNNDMYQNGTHPHKSCGCKDPHVFSYHIDTGCVDPEENLGLWFALKIAGENGVANIDNLEIIEAQPLTGEALARVKKREQRWKQERDKKRLETEKAVQTAQGAIQNLFTNTQQNLLKFETLFPQIVNAEMLVQQIPYVYHPFLSGALPAVAGMNFKIVQQLSATIGNARSLYNQRNLVQNGTFSSGTGSWHVSEGVEVQPLQNTSVLVLSEWSHEASQQVSVDPDRGYVLRVTARKEGVGKGTVTLSDCADYTETLTFTSCDFNTSGSQTMTSGTLSGFVTKTLEIFPDTDRIRIDIGETEGTFKIESVELICMEQMEDDL
ncbi:insecticidal delta-endotoxin Cry8Ea1 family protein [Bacillus toyonensis]|uniref:Crystaline entomocidal protoxin n=1 Tax=Bacillus thuringiensis TaxID=1428 RepID=Q8VUL1_BACTU|nr:insecticidal delta-endotoxin Cry8Ea1 family protein [Bacillus toyonensis]MED3086437.1 insecticidal delta-endotoxin Cry8Ea1 family protein [Bacillus toyonensis]BAB78601.1 crystal protein CryE6L [Bacillus thuringiensis]